MAVLKEPEPRHGKNGDRSFYQLIAYLMLTSRLDNYGMLFTSFGGGKLVLET